MSKDAPHKGRARTFYHHPDSARKGEAWARDKVDVFVNEAQVGKLDLPNVGRGYTDIYRAAHKVYSIAQAKLRYALPPWEKVFWQSVSDEANAIKGEQN